MEKRYIINLQDDEHLISIYLTFSFESINSIKLITNKEKTYIFGKEKEFTVVS